MTCAPPDLYDTRQRPQALLPAHSHRDLYLFVQMCNHISVIVLNVHGYTLAEQGTNVAGKSDMSRITQESSHVLLGPCLFLSHLIIVIVI